MLKCPLCGSQNIEPKGQGFHCNDCDQDFDQAMAPLPKVDKKGNVTSWG